MLCDINGQLKEQAEAPVLMKKTSVIDITNKTSKETRQTMSANAQRKIKKLL